MENASKALIIAGAILVSILLISLGVMIYTQAASTIKNNMNLSDTEIQAFNSKFTKYEGKQKGSTIRSMVQEVLANNNSEDNANLVEVSGKVTLSKDADSSPTYGNGFKNTATYEVSFEYTKGLVSKIVVE